MLIAPGCCRCGPQPSGSCRVAWPWWAGAIAAYALVSAKAMSSLAQARRTAALADVQQAITASLKNRTITLGKEAS